MIGFSKIENQLQLSTENPIVISDPFYIVLRRWTLNKRNGEFKTIMNERFF